MKLIRNAAVSLLLGLTCSAQAFVLLGHSNSYQEGSVLPGDFVYKWGDFRNIGTTGGTVTYSFLDESVACGRTAQLLGILAGRQGCRTSNPQSVFGAGFEGLFAQAFGNWSSQADIDFVQVPDSGVESGRDQPGQAGMIRIGAARFDTNNDFAFSVIGPFGHENGLEADIFFNAALFGSSPWDTDALLDVAMHEIGHSIGLGHSFTSGTVMAAFSSTLLADLGADDLAGVQTLYGLRQPVPEPATVLLMLVGLAALAQRQRFATGQVCSGVCKMGDEPTLR